MKKFITPVLIVENEEIFDMMLNNQEFEISKNIVKSILLNLDSKKQNVKVLSIELEEENEIQDISLNRDDFADTLEENLVHFEKEEMYEECIVIKRAIDKLRAQYLLEKNGKRSINSKKKKTQN